MIPCRPLHPLVLALLWHASAPETAQAEELTPPQRTEILFEGITIEFREDEADVVELLKPALLDYRIKRRQQADAEIAQVLKVLEGPQVRPQVRDRIVNMVPQAAESETFDQSFDEALEDIRQRVEFWRQWTAEVEQVRLWNRWETEDFRDEDTGRIAFGELAYAHGENGSVDDIFFVPPFITKGLGLDAIRDPSSGPVEPMILDLPIFYRAGFPAEVIVQLPRGILERLPAMAPQTVLPEMLRRLGTCLLESVARRELRRVIFTDDPANNVLVEGTARYLALLAQLASGDSEKQSAAIAAVAHFPAEDEDDQPAALEFLKNMDLMTDTPADPDERFHRLAGLARRNLMAMSLLELTRTDPSSIGPPVFHRLKAESIEIPDGGFDAAGFLSALDTVFGDDDALQTRLATLRENAVLRLTQGMAEARQPATDDPDPATTEPVAPPPKRTTSRFGEYQISHPESIAEAIAEVGPELAAAWERARHKGSEAFDKLTTLSIEVSPEDADALERYGLDADFDTLRQWTIGTSAFMNPESPLMMVLGSNRAQVWFKEELAEYLLGGGAVDGFTYDAGRDKVNYTFNMLSNFDLEAIESADQVAAAFKSQTGGFVLPVILDLPPESDVSAADIREAQPDVFGGDDIDAALDPEKLRLASPEQVFFIAVHETVEMQLITQCIGSPDRRWFCDGMANWIALQECERRFGEGRGAEVFETIYPPAKYEPLADEVDLFEWPAVEDIESGARRQRGDAHAYYYFATRVIEAACEGRDDEFVERWLDALREVPWNRTRAEHVLSTYQDLTGNDLSEIVGQVVSVASE